MKIAFYDKDIYPGEIIDLEDDDTRMEVINKGQKWLFSRHRRYLKLSTFLRKISYPIKSLIFEILSYYECRLIEYLFFAS